MRNLFILLFSALLLSACSSSKDFQVGGLTQEPCKSETQITNPNQFLGETVENLRLVPSGNTVTAYMDVRTYCNSNLSISGSVKGKELRLMLKNENTAQDDCFCKKTISTTLTNVEKGTFDVLVTNSSGSQLLAQESLTVN